MREDGGRLCGKSPSHKPGLAVGARGSLGEGGRTLAVNLNCRKPNWFPHAGKKKAPSDDGPSRDSACPANETREGSRTETARLRDLVAWHFRRRIPCRIRSWVGHRLRRFISRIARGIVQGFERRVLCGRIYRIV